MMTPRNRRLAISALIATVFIVAMMPASAYGASYHPALLASLPLNPSNWVAIAFLAILAIIVVAAMVYMLSGAAGSSAAKSWAHNQILEAIISIVLLMIFAAFAYLFLSNPQTAFGSLNLVPSGCTGANTLYTLSTCDIGQFSNNAYNLTQAFFFTSFLVGFSPGIGFKITIPGLEGIDMGFTLSDIVPVAEEKLLQTGFIAMFFMLMLNQVQVILIAGGLLWLSLFVTLGLVVRCFGVTRTFGGALIALGLGLGLVYPVLVAVTYGYIDVQAGILSFGVILWNMVQSLTTLLIAAITGGLSGSGVLYVCNISYVCDPQFLNTIGLIIAGLTFIPFLNFVVLDSFIRDFSSSIGEPINFLQMLSGLV